MERDWTPEEFLVKYAWKPNKANMQYWRDPQRDSQETLHGALHVQVGRCLANGATVPQNIRSMVSWDNSTWLKRESATKRDEFLKSEMRKDAR